MIKFYKNLKKRQRSLKLFLLIAINFSLDYENLLAQDSIKNLQIERRKLIKQITHVRKTLKNTEIKAKEKSEKIIALTKQIEINSLILQNIDDEISEIEKEIEEKKASISMLLNDLESLKKEYARIIYIGYKATQGIDQMTYIFSSSSFHELAERLRYVKHYAKFRKKHFEEMKKIHITLSKQKESSEKYVLQKRSLLLMKKQEIANLVKLKKEHAILVSELVQNQECLKKELQVHNFNVKKLDLLIKTVIEKSIEDSEKERKQQEEKLKLSAKGKRKKVGNPVDSIEKASRSDESIDKSSNKEGRRIIKYGSTKIKSSDFARHKGNMPWPVADGIIVGKVGVWPHPILKGIQVENLGINIQTKVGNKAKAIFDGEVKSVTYIPGMQNVVIMQHGRYHTVYTRLDNVCVKIGECIKQGQIIGTVHTNDSGYAETQLQIWEGTTKVNPQQWLRKNSNTHKAL